MSERDETIERAIRERRISAAQADEYRRLYDAQPAVMMRLLTASVENGGLMPGLAADHEAVETAYDPAWLTPQERTAVASRQSPSPGPAPAAPAPAQAASPPPAAPEAGEGYDETWLSPKERNRISAAKNGTLKHGPVQFEDDAAKTAAGTAQA